MQRRQRWQLAVAALHSAAVVSVTLNVPPLHFADGAGLQVTPTEGPSTTTEFLLLASGWTDLPEDLPLSYHFAYHRVTADAPLVVPLADGGLSHRLQTPLPPGALRARLTVADALGCSGPAVEVAVAVRSVSLWTEAAALALNATASARYEHFLSTAAGWAVSGAVVVALSRSCGIGGAPYGTAARARE